MQLADIETRPRLRFGAVEQRDELQLDSPNLQARAWRCLPVEISAPGFVNGRKNRPGSTAGANGSSRCTSTRLHTVRGGTPPSAGAFAQAR